MSLRETKTPGIPDIRDDNVKEVLRAIKSTLEVREGHSGDPLDENVTYRHLKDLGLADDSTTTNLHDGSTLPVGPPGGGSDGYNPNTDLSTPPAPMNLRVTGGFVALYLEWDGANYRNHSYTEIWRAAVDDLTKAIRVGSSITSMYADPAEPDSEYWYWIRFVSRANITGPWNSTSGTYGRTAYDVAKIIRVLSKEIVDSSLMQDLSQRIDKIDADAYISNRAFVSTLDKLEVQVDNNSSRLLELHSITQSQATSLQILESKGPSGNRVFFSDIRPDSDVHGVVDGTAVILGDVWYDTNDSNRSYRWTGPTEWVEFMTAGVKVYHQPADPASNNGTNWVDATGRVMMEGDLWYDSDNGNHPWFWSNATHTWLDNASGDVTAAIITLEQTKIGYATLVADCQFGVKDSVFDNGGVIWNNVAVGDTNFANSAKKWNADHTDIPTEQVLWHVGIPFAQSVKQVGVTTSTGGTATLQNKMEAYQKSDDTLLAQYTVKLDVNGYVAGFGLASWQSSDLVHASSFIVNADRFAIGPAMPASIWNGALPYAKNDLVRMSGGTPVVWHVFQARQAVPANSGHTPQWGIYDSAVDAWWVDLSARLPFIATTTATVIDGKTYPPGVWMQTAGIADASIISAQIGSLTADKITSGTLSVATSISVGGTIFGGVNPGQTIPGPNCGQGFLIGAHDGNFKFFIGNSNTDYVYWQGSIFEVKGHIIGTSGSIGGINMSFANLADPSSGRLYTTGVSGFNSGSGGFWLDATSKFRIGNPNGARLTWDGGNLFIYNSSNVVIFATGDVANGVSWDALIGTAPYTVDNSYIGIQNGPTPGTIIKNNSPGSTATGVVMPGNPITGGNVSTYIAAAAITDAYIGQRIQSYGFNGSFNADGTIASTGTTGWAIDKLGNAVFNGLLCTAKVQSNSLLIDALSGQELYSAASGSWNGSRDWGANIIWDPATRLYGSAYHSNYPARARVRTAGSEDNQVIPLIINFSGTVDHWLSLWARRNDGQWVFLGTVKEPQGDYGSVSFSMTGLSNMQYWDYLDFGFSPTDQYLRPINSYKTAVEYFSFSVMMLNV